MSILGRTAGGWAVSSPYRPSMIDFSLELAAALPRPEASIPIPICWPFDTSKEKILLEPPPASCAEIRAMFGFIASIADAESSDADSAFLVTAVAKLFFRYGCESRYSFVYARVNA